MKLFNKNKLNWEFLTIGIFSLTGLYASFILTIDRFETLKNASYKLDCNINQVFQCGSAMMSKEAELLGFPNTLIGLIFYSGIFATAVYFLFQKQINKYFSLLLLLFSGFSFLFSYWLLSISIFKLNSLCPYCILSCLSVTNIFFALIIFNIRSKYLSVGNKIDKHIHKFIEKNLYWPIIVGWYAIIISITFLHFYNA